MLGLKNTRKFFILIIIIRTKGMFPIHLLFKYFINNHYASNHIKLKIHDPLKSSGPCQGGNLIVVGIIIREKNGEVRS